MVINKLFGVKDKGGPIMYSSMTVLTAMIFFLCNVRDFHVTLPLFLYSCGFAAAYGGAVLFSMLSLKHGSMAKTSLISNFSLMLPTLFGIVFLHEDFGILLLVGLVLLSVSLVLINRRGADDSAVRTTKMWVVFVSIAFVTNGCCSIVQKMEGLACSPDSGNLFMSIALAIAFVVLITASAVSEKGAVMKKTVVNCWYWAIPAGLLNAVVNFLVIKLNPMLPASVLFPAISAGGVVLNRILSQLLFREKFDWKQNLGFLAGVLAVVLLNL